MAKNASSLFQKLAVFVTDRSEKDIRRWRDAIEMAENPETPERSELINLYKDIMLDAHLHAQVQVRKTTTLSRKFAIIGKDGKEDKEKTELFKEPWFYEFLKHTIDSIFYGVSVLEFGGFDENNKIKGFNLIPRAHTLSLLKKIVFEIGDENGENYADPKHKAFIIEVGEDHLGLLSKVANSVIWKKNAMQSWAQFSELFGIPIRWVTSDNRDSKTLDEIESTLENMGEAAYGIFPQGTNFELKETSRGDAYNVYDKMIERHNGEISKAINSVTMLSDNGSSKSQSQVHLEISDRVTFADGNFTEGIINNKLIPLLNLHGFKLENFRFQWDNTQKLDKKDQWTIVQNLLQTNHEIPIDWISENFNIPITARAKPVENKTAVENRQQHPNPYGNFSAVQTSKVGTLALKNTDTVLNEEQKTITNLFSNLLKQVYKNDKTFKQLLNDNEWTKLFKFTAEKLFKGTEKGFGKKLVNLDFDTPDAELLRQLQTNIYEFSAFKDAGLLTDLNGLLIKDGKRREWNDFKHEALKLNGKYNINWLQAEYEQSIASAQMASKWLEFKDGADLFYLQYQTVGDNLVRPSHAKLDGITLPLNDAFWKSHTPPNGWRCRCDVVQVPKNITKVTDLSKRELIKPDKGFDFNPGEAGKIFDTSNYKKRVPVKEQKEVEQISKKTALTEKYKAIYKDKWKENYTFAEMIDIPENLPLDKKLNFIAKEINKIKTNELGFSLNSKGEIIERFSGIDTQVQTNFLEKDSILIHNHPNGKHLSSNDIIVSSKFNLKSMIAVGGDKEYKINRPKKGWVTREKIVDKMLDLEDEAFEKLDPFKYIEYKEYGISLDIFKEFNLEQKTTKI